MNAKKMRLFRVVVHDSDGSTSTIAHFTRSIHASRYVAKKNSQSDDFFEVETVFVETVEMTDGRLFLLGDEVMRYDANSIYAEAKSKLSPLERTVMGLK